MTESIWGRLSRSAPQITWSRWTTKVYWMWNGTAAMTTGREVTGSYLQLKAVAAICTAIADRPRSMSFRTILQILATSARHRQSRINRLLPLQRVPPILFRLRGPRLKRRGTKQCTGPCRVQVAPRMASLQFVTGERDAASSKSCSKSASQLQPISLWYFGGRWAWLPRNSAPPFRRRFHDEYTVERRTLLLRQWR